MSGDARYARLQWRCRRGMRELDNLLMTFLQNTFGTLDDDDKSRFETVLNLPDPELYGYLAGRSMPKDPGVAALIEHIRAGLGPQA